MNDYDKAVDAPEDYGFSAILERMKELSTGAWKYDPAHLTLTEDGADLETGHKALELVEVTELNIIFNLHCYTKIAGKNVSLNLPHCLASGQVEGACDAIREMYLDQAETLLRDLDYLAWDGDDWEVPTCDKFCISLPLDEAGNVMVDETVDFMIEWVQGPLVSWERKISELNLKLDKLAGWKDEEGNDVPEFTTTNCSVYSHWVERNAMTFKASAPAGMRRVMVSKPTLVDGMWEMQEQGQALFHQFGVDYEELRDGVGNHSTAIIEWPDGKVDSVHPSHIKFL